SGCRSSGGVRPRRQRITRSNMVICSMTCGWSIPTHKAEKAVSPLAFCFLLSLFVRLAVALPFAPELLLVGVDTVLQPAQLLCERIGQMDLVEVVGRGRDTLAVDLDHARLDADDRRVRRHLLQNDRVRADAAVVAH